MSCPDAAGGHSFATRGTFLDTCSWIIRAYRTSYAIKAVSINNKYLMSSWTFPTFTLTGIIAFSLFALKNRR